MKPSLLFIFLSFLFLSGCKVGPNYHPPAVYLPEDYIEDQQDKTFEVEDENLVHWWSIFNDPFLDLLLDTAIVQNYDYRIAIEQVYQARSQYWVQFTQILPEFDATNVDTRFRVSRAFRTSNDSIANNVAASNATTTLSPIQNFFQVGLDAIWEIDLWGKFRRAADAAYDLYEASEDEVRGVKITLISEVVNTYAVICSYQKKKDIAEQNLNLDMEIVTLSRSRLEAGLTDQQEVETSLAALEADQAQLTIIEAALKSTIYSLSVLLGNLPETVIGDFLIERPIPQAEGKVPVGLPSELLRRRPDIRAAERQLAAATEHIGVAVADLFPTLSLTGSSSSFAANPLQGANIGYSSDRFNKLFHPEALIWGIGAFITAPIFDFGKRTAAIDVQIALRNQAYYIYQKTVLAALQETEQALEIYFNDEIREKSLYIEAQANWRILVLTKDLFQAGLANYTQVLQAKYIWLASLNTLTDSQQALATDLVAIYKALGGDW